MDTARTIGKLAGEAGVPISTVRHYERAGLLRPQARTSGNYRVYGDEELQRLLFVRAAQSAGFTLGDIHSILELRDGVRRPCSEVESLIDERLGEVETQMKRLRHVRSVLRRFHVACEETNSDDCCPVIEELSLAARDGRGARNGRGKRKKS